MNKSILGVIALLAFFTGATAFSNKTAPVVGKFSPNLNLHPIDTVENQEINIKKGNEDYTLLNFWTSSDVNSRLKGKAYEQWLNSEKNSKEGLRYFSVNLDDNSKLSDEIKKIDKLDNKYQFVGDKENRVIIKDFKLENEMKTFLLDSRGEIVMINPTVTEIETLL